MTYADYLIALARGLEPQRTYPKLPPEMAPHIEAQYSRLHEQLEAVARRKRFSFTLAISGVSQGWDEVVRDLPSANSIDGYFQHGTDQSLLSEHLRNLGLTVAVLKLRMRMKRAGLAHSKGPVVEY